jgi:hypothetical protein
MKLEIIHGGQTGVDRGAHHGARDAGFSIGGYAPADGRDELGPIPTDVMHHLMLAPYGGTHVRTSLNVGKAHAVLVVVANRFEPYATPGTAHTLQLTRRALVPRLLVEGDCRPDLVLSWFRNIWCKPDDDTAPDRMRRLLVAGPRASRWQDGERLTRKLVASFADVSTW